MSRVAEDKTQKELRVAGGWVFLWSSLDGLELPMPLGYRWRSC